MTSYEPGFYRVSILPASISQHRRGKHERGGNNANPHSGFKRKLIGATPRSMQIDPHIWAIDFFEKGGLDIQK